MAIFPALGRLCGISRTINRVPVKERAILQAVCKNVMNRRPLRENGVKLTVSQVINLPELALERGAGSVYGIFLPAVATSGMPYDG